MRGLILTTFAFVFLITGCGYFETEKRKTNEKTDAGVTSVPFSTKMPARFSADLELSAIDENGEKTLKYFVAHDGKKALEKYSVGSATEFWVLWTDNGEVLRLNPKAKTYEKIETSKLTGRSDQLSKSLTAQWIYKRNFRKYEKVSTENGLTKYIVKPELAKESKIVLFVDEELNFPVRQDSYSLRGGKEELVYKAEFKNISTEPKPSLFEIPNGYETVQ